MISQAGVAGHPGDSAVPCRNQWPCPVVHTLSCNVGYWWTEPFCGESPAFLSLPLRRHFYPPPQRDCPP